MSPGATDEQADGVRERLFRRVTRRQVAAYSMLETSQLRRDRLVENHRRREIRLTSANVAEKLGDDLGGNVGGHVLENACSWHHRPRVDFARRNDHDRAAARQMLGAAVPKGSGAAQHQADREEIVRVPGKALRMVGRSHQLDRASSRHRHSGDLSTIAPRAKGAVRRSRAHRSASLGHVKNPQNTGSAPFLIASIRTSRVRDAQFRPGIHEVEHCSRRARRRMAIAPPPGDHFG
jgi:hypothetical protein